jgi:hypothetical protein
MRSHRPAQFHFIAAGILAVIFSGCRQEPSPPNGGAPVLAGEASETWTPLFDGSTFAGWRGYGRDDVPDGWIIDDGALHFTRADGDINTGIITEQTFSDFELQFEWRIAPAGNSGVFFHVVEGRHDAIWKTGPEYQIVDNAGHPDGRNPVTSAASNYALHGPEQDHAKPAGEYNEGRIVVRGGRVQHWLNGRRVVDYYLGDSDWLARVEETGFRDWPAYGLARTGHIAIQEGGPVWYRNLRIRVPEE